MTEERWEAAKKQPCQWVLEQNRKVTSWPEVYLVALAAKSNLSCKELLPGLADQLTDRSERKLTQTHRLIIWERIISGDLLFEGEGLQVSDDLFTVAGRANWLLRNLTQKNFGSVLPKASKESLAALQTHWKRFLAGENVADVPEPYPSKKDGLTELRSPAALEALIVSLAPSPEKDALTKRCLKDTYHLDKMPEAPDAAGRLCNPDAFANTYLEKLTGIAEPHPHDWWARWWKKNRNELHWSAEKAQFLTR